MAGVVTLKSIKPRKFNRTALEHKLRSEFNSCMQGVKYDFEQTVETWEPQHKPQFRSWSLTMSGWVWFAKVFTESELYALVEHGAKRHDIPSSGSTFMAFGEKYAAKTFPEAIGSFEGGESGHVIYAYEVDHPGFVGRNFSVVIAKKWRKELVKRMDRAISIGVGLSGHEANDLFKPNAGRFIPARSSASDFISRFGGKVSRAARQERDQYQERSEE